MVLLITSCGWFRKFAHSFWCLWKCTYWETCQTWKTEISLDVESLYPSVNNDDAIDTLCLYLEKEKNKIHALRAGEVIKIRIRYLHRHVFSLLTQTCGRACNGRNFKLSVLEKLFSCSLWTFMMTEKLRNVVHASKI